MERLEGEPHTRLRYFCSPQHTDSAHYPIIGQMERAAGLGHGDTAQVKFDKLDALLAQTSTSKLDAALFAEMLSLPNDGRYPALNMDPQRRRQKTLEALTVQLEALSRQKPALMIFEDAHWSDPTSLETFGRVVDKVRSLPALLIVTFRPEFEPPWIGQSYSLRSGLDALTSAGLLFRQGVPPSATYLFKHALVRDAAYGTLLREPRRALHARIAETLESQFADIAETQPEVLAHHCTDAGLIEKAAGLWGKAGQRSLARAAFLEGAEQLKRALDQIATLPTTPDLRREEIKLEVAFGNALALMGDFVGGKEHYDRALAIYDPAEHRALTTRSGRDVGVFLLWFVRTICGCSVTPRLHSMKASAQSKRPARSATPLH
jgi:predicted ATPase